MMSNENMIYEIPGNNMAIDLNQIAAIYVDASDIIIITIGGSKLYVYCDVIARMLQTDKYIGTEWHEKSINQIYSMLVERWELRNKR